MDIIVRAALLQSQAVCAMVEAMSMQSTNHVRLAAGKQVAYDEADFKGLIDKYGISHNAAKTYLSQ